MISLEPNSTVLVEDDVSKLVDFLVRYTHGEEYSENELQTVLSISQLNSVPSSLIEESFLDYHIDYIRMRCAAVLADESKISQLGMDQRLNLLLTLWKDVVCPDNLTQLDVLTSNGVDMLLVVFATMIRYFLDIPALVSWLSEERNTHHIHEICKMGLDEEANAALAQIIPTKIDLYIHSTWKARYAPNVPADVKRWVLSTLIPDIQHILEQQPGQKAKVPVSQISELAMASLARLRISELYDIVEEGSTLGVDDLAQALTDRPDLREETVRCFTKQCEQRLLNGASDTVEIIQMLLKTIRAFSVLDPQGILLERVSQPIKSMLKERSDTSVKLAEGLFGDVNSALSFLFDDLQKQAKPKTNVSALQEFETWVPDPIDTPADFVRKQTQDSVSTLIDLYDNKEVFIKQFVSLFGAELLNKPFDRETNLPHLINLFKLLGARFGTSNMQKIAVMLEDVQRSDAVDRQIQNQAREQTDPVNLAVVSPLILSRLYWPSLPRKSASAVKSIPESLPPQFQDLLKRYTDYFSQQPDFNSLELHWLPNKGRVRIQLTLADRTVDVVVEPSEAALISAFGSDDEEDNNSSGSVSLTLGELLERTNLEEPQLLSAIQFWVDQGVLGTEGERYKVLETSEEVEQQRKELNQVISSTDVTSTTASTSSSKQTKDAFEEMHLYWSYIVGMLTNLGSLTVDKIHSFLVMFVPNEDPYVKTKQELESYLLAMVDDDKLICEDGKYSLPKA